MVPTMFLVSNCSRRWIVFLLFTSVPYISITCAATLDAADKLTACVVATNMGEGAIV